MISLVPGLLCLPGEALHPSLKELLLSARAVSAPLPLLQAALGWAVWLLWQRGALLAGGKERTQAGVGCSNAVWCVWAALMPEALSQTRLL